METVTDLRNRLTVAQIAKTQENTKEAHEMHQATMKGYERCIVIYEKILEKNGKDIANLNKLLGQKEEEVIIANLCAEKIEREALIAAKNEEIATLRGALAEQKNRFSVLFASVGSGIIAILLKNLFPKKKN